jgi:hypothetical protein
MSFDSNPLISGSPGRVPVIEWDKPMLSVPIIELPSTLNVRHYSCRLDQTVYARAEINEWGKIDRTVVLHFKAQSANIDQVDWSSKENPNVDPTSIYQTYVNVNLPKEKTERVKKVLVNLMLPEKTGNKAEDLKWKRLMLSVADACKNAFPNMSSKDSLFLIYAGSSYWKQILFTN